MTRVLVVEDDPGIAEGLELNLALEGYAVRVATSGSEGLELARRWHPALIVLDLMLPLMDGMQVLRALREDDDQVPVLILSARGDETDRLRGFRLGADDYVVKPFGFRELVARIRAVTRRAASRQGIDVEAEPDPVLHAGRVEVDTRTRRATVDGREVTLTRKEFDLLALLAGDPGATRTRDEILEEVWDAHWYGPTKTLDVHVASLRKKLGDPTLIETVRGVGFRLGSGT